jgi:hypothetical protein
MIYYLKQQVSLGDKVNLNGVKVELTQQIVDDNPELFEVVCEDDILIKEARNRYKVGDVIDGLASNKIRSRINNLYQIRISNHKVLVDGAHDNGCALVLFENNKWAEVVEDSTKEAYDSQELLEEAKNRYSKGCRIRIIKGARAGKVCPLLLGYGFVYEDGDILSYTGHRSYYTIYSDGKWAEVVEPLLTSEDGVNLYEGDSYWWVDIKHNKYELSSKCTCKKEIFEDNYPVDSVVFSTKGAARKYIDENKPKDFEILSFINNSNSVIFNKVKGFDGFSSLNTGYFDKEHSEEFLLKQDHFSIHSVKRLSDGEVFTIGDLCCPNSLPSNKAKITEFGFCKAGYFRISSVDKYHLNIKSLVKCEEKTLADYEDILLNNADTIKSWQIYDNSRVSLTYGAYYRILKEREPRLYYAKILKLIADDLNGDWKASFSYPRNQKYYIIIDGEGNTRASYTFGGVCGIVYFKSEELAQKAIDIMGDKLDYILK